mmetsp:Transcript_126934/g.201281  ORF Transcript_126934/g.201281 Transcript_126934/m.201281 type:complete len:952 (-) Transcript_126934:115-2970(-)
MASSFHDNACKEKLFNAPLGMPLQSVSQFEKVRHSLIGELGQMRKAVESLCEQTDVLSQQLVDLRHERPLLHAPALPLQVQQKCLGAISSRSVAEPSRLPVDHPLSRTFSLPPRPPPLLESIPSDAVRGKTQPLTVAVATQTFAQAVEAQATQTTPQSPKSPRSDDSSSESRESNHRYASAGSQETLSNSETLGSERSRSVRVQTAPERLSTGSLETVIDALTSARQKFMSETSPLKSERRVSEPALGRSKLHPSPVDSETHARPRGRLHMCPKKPKALPATLDERRKSKSFGVTSWGWKSPLQGEGQVEYSGNYFMDLTHVDRIPSSVVAPSSSSTNRILHCAVATSESPCSTTPTHAPDVAAGGAKLQVIDDDTKLVDEGSSGKHTFVGTRRTSNVSSVPSSRRISNASSVALSSRRSSKSSESIESIVESLHSIHSSHSGCTQSILDVSNSDSEDQSMSRRATVNTSRRSSLSSATWAHLMPGCNAADTVKTQTLASISSCSLHTGSWALRSSKHSMNSAHSGATGTTHRTSVTIFDLQRHVSNALTECEGTELVTEYIGVPCLHWAFAAQTWGVSGSSFSSLRKYLQIIGILCWTPAFAVLLPDGARSFATTIRHLCSLGYIIMWHLAMLGCLAWMVSPILSSFSLPSFFQAVQALLLLISVIAHALCIRHFHGVTPPKLISIAIRWCFIHSWETSVLRTAFCLLPLLSVLTATAAFPKRDSSMETVLGSASTVVAVVVAMLGWTLLLTLYLLLAMVVQFCSLGLDAFALDLLNAPRLDGLKGLVGQFNVLIAAIRRAAYAVQWALAVFGGLTLALAIAAICFVTLPALSGNDAAWDGKHCEGCDGIGDAIAVSWAVVLLLLGLRLLNHIADVNLKCKRLPALVHSLDFGKEVDHDRWCVAAHIAASEAGFPIHSVLITRGAVLKIGYISLAGFCLLITQFATMYGG